MKIKLKNRKYIRLLQFSKSDQQEYCDIEPVVLHTITPMKSKMCDNFLMKEIDFSFWRS